MKKFLLPLLFLILSFTTYANYLKGTIILKDKTEMAGLIELGKNNSVNFKTDKKSIKVEISAEKIESVLIIGNKQNINKYEFHLTSTKTIVGNKEIMRLLQVLIDGKMKLYGTSTSFTNYNGTGYSSSTYFLKRNDEIKPVFFVAFGYIVKQNFREFIKEYFKDCEAIISKVERKELKEKNYTEIVEYYNSTCK